MQRCFPKPILEPDRLAQRREVSRQSREWTLNWFQQHPSSGHDRDINKSLGLGKHLCWTRYGSRSFIPRALYIGGGLSSGLLLSEFFGLQTAFFPSIISHVQ
jgi:hypothetical protein